MTTGRERVGLREASGRVPAHGLHRLSRRAFLAGTAATAVSTVGTKRAVAQAKPTITYWNGLTGADGKVMDELIDRFTRETGIRIEQQRLPWATCTRSSRSPCPRVKDRTSR
jgi:hypothetical protein